MKKINNLIICITTIIILSFAFYSCSNENEIGIEQNKTQLNKANLGVTSVKIDNGITSDGNNILVFENEEYLVKNFERLISEHEIHNENLDKVIPSELVDDELDDYMLKNNLDEDYVLDEFEKKLAFTSLRKIINKKEAKWLDLQGEKWDINTDPDNLFIASDFDRTFLNEGAEVIIKNEKGQEIIHKYFEWGDIQLDIDDVDLLKEINVKNIGDAKTISSLSKNIKVNMVNSTDSGCRTKGHHVSYYKVNGQQLKGFTTQNVGLFDKTLVAKTRGYQWKRGKWRNRRVWIHAGISGINKSSWTAYNNCAGIIPGNPNWKDKKRRKLEYRLPNNSNIIKLTVKNNTVYSYHSQSGNSVFVDFYDYNSVPIYN